MVETERSSSPKVKSDIVLEDGLVGEELEEKSRQKAEQKGG